jgi:Fe-S cluster assembly protein SufD
VFINGRLDESLSRLAGLSLSRELPALALADVDQPFNALNAACAREGATLRVGKEAKIDGPVQVVYAGDGGAAFARLRIELEPGAELALEEHFAGTGRHFLGSITEAVVGANASLKHARVIADSAQAVHMGAFHARLDRDARLTLDSVVLEAAFARSELRVILDGEGASADLRGLALAHGAALLDHQVLVDHARPHCTSRQLFRNIVDDKARAVFAGRVIVRPGAMGTDAQQQNNNLLLSDDARVDTKPQLEIYADDVKCSHGATSGQLDPAMVFFLRARGLDEKQARAVLTYAFANEIVQHVAVPGVQATLASAMNERFHWMTDAS